MKKYTYAILFVIFSLTYCTVFSQTGNLSDNLNVVTNGPTVTTITPDAQTTGPGTATYAETTDETVDKAVLRVETNDYDNSTTTYYADGSRMIVSKGPDGSSTVKNISADGKYRKTEITYPNGRSVVMETTVAEDGTITTTVKATDEEGMVTETTKVRKPRY